MKRSTQLYDTITVLKIRSTAVFSLFTEPLPGCRFGALAPDARAPTPRPRTLRVMSGSPSRPLAPLSIAQDEMMDSAFQASEADVVAARLAWENVGTAFCAQSETAALPPSQTPPDPAERGLSGEAKFALDAAKAAFDARMRDDARETWPLADLAKLSTRSWPGGGSYRAKDFPDSSFEPIVEHHLTEGAGRAFRSYVERFGCYARRVPLDAEAREKHKLTFAKIPPVFTEVVVSAEAVRAFHRAEGRRRLSLEGLITP